MGGNPVFTEKKFPMLPGKNRGFLALVFHMRALQK
jgi:hypothetical protein